jgi:hypothetical protein
LKAPNATVELAGAPLLPVTCKEDLTALIIWLDTSKNQELLVRFKINLNIPKLYKKS